MRRCYFTGVREMFDAELIDRLTDEYLFDLPKTKYQIAEQFE